MFTKNFGVQIFFKLNSIPLYNCAQNGSLLYFVYNIKCRQNSFAASHLTLVRTSLELSNWLVLLEESQLLICKTAKAILLINTTLIQVHVYLVLLVSFPLYVM